ncbi:MAG: M1 family metallopeptidase [bacterium]|nr:M1 family metallopeptidase [bacterium]
MKRFTILLLILITRQAFAQDFDYRSKENPYYWKNKLPVDGYWQQDVHYKMKVSLNDQTDVVSGLEELTYYNNSPDTLREVYFHLYQNAFLKGGYLEQLNLANNFHQKFGKYEAEGKGTKINSIEVGNKALKYWIDFSIMKVFLAEPILPGASMKFEVNFATYFDNGGNQRRRMKMFTDNAGNKQFDVVHWYPRICVYDKKFGWETYQHLGKEFYGDFGQFDISITLPNHYIMDGTGELVNEQEVLPSELRKKLDLKNFANKPWEEKASVIVEPNGSSKTWIYKSVNTHDFAWTCDPTYRIDEVVLPMPENPRGKVRCIALVQEPHASGWQDAALFNSKIIALYSKEFGVYAYPKMICADARDGMEYPMITLDGGRSPGYYGLFAHEIGHNWFFGMVGTNETYRASLDEGFTQFLTHWSMSRLTKEVKKVKTASPWFNKYYRPMASLDQTVYQGYLRDAINQNDMPLNTHSDDFKGALNHGGGYGHVYYKTATMLYNLQYVLGDSLFQKAMQHYFNQWKMAHPYTEDFRNSIIAYTHVDLNWFFDQWLETTKTIDYGVKRAKHYKKLVWEIELERKGDMQMPLDILLTFKDTTPLKLTIPNTYFSKTDFGKPWIKWLGWGKLNTTYKLVVPRGQKLLNVEIDPSHRLADVNELNNSLKCPVLFTFDHQISNPPDRKLYFLKWRPDVWYNQYDGLKLGLHLNGHYLKLKHVFSFTAWYNSRVLASYDNALYANSSARYPVHYALSYKHRFAPFADVFFQSRMLDGLFLNKLGIEKTKQQNTYRLYIKLMRRVQLYYLPSYQQTLMDNSNFIPTLSSYDEWNNTLNLEYDRSFGYLGGGSKFSLAFKTNMLGSDFDYSALSAQLVQTHPLWRFELRSRVYAAIITGSNIAPESQLYLAGANQEEMADNKFNRSAGIVPSAWFQYGAQSNHYQAGGGLNLRGFTGYLVPVMDGVNQAYLYRGNAGASVNLELDYDQYLGFLPSNRYLKLDAYLFLDAGILAARNLTNKDQTLAAKAVNLNTGLMACGGHGLVLTIKRWGVLDEVKPLSIRFDIPLYLSNAPAYEGENLMFRWVLGVSRAF